MHMYQVFFFGKKNNKLKLKLFQSLGNYLNVTCFHHNNRHEKKILKSEDWLRAMQFY